MSFTRDCTGSWNCNWHLLKVVGTWSKPIANQQNHNCGIVIIIIIITHFWNQVEYLELVKFKESLKFLIGYTWLYMVVELLVNGLRKA